MSLVKTQTRILHFYFANITKSGKVSAPLFQMALIIIYALFSSISLGTCILSSASLNPSYSTDYTAQ